MEEEISLREIIDTLWRGKWIIVGITALFVLVAGIYSYLIADSVYESNSSVLITNSELPTENLTEYVNNATSRDVVMEVMKSPEVLAKTIDEIGIERNVSSLQSSIGITTSENNESLINLSIEGADREEIASILDAVVENTQIAIEQKLSTYFSSYEEMHLERMNEEEVALEDYLEEYEQLEAESGLPLLVLFQQNASGSQYMLEANEEMLNELRDLDKITQVEYEQINSKINTANSNYVDYHAKYEEATSLNGTEIASERIQSLSDAYTGVNPVSPNKLLNIAIALVLGVMISVFVVFIRNYLKETSS